MSSTGISKGFLEVGKFVLYVSLPIVLMYNLANNSENMKKLIEKRPYIVHPPEAQRPPSPEELREMARDLARKRDQGHLHQKN